MLFLSRCQLLATLHIIAVYAEVNVDSQSQNANHIFNAIHSSMRQFGSSLNHNGMSMFIATVPADVELYHGTSRPDPVNGTQWLAFEPEHALIFARGQRPPGRGPPPHDDSRRAASKGGERREGLRAGRAPQHEQDRHNPSHETMQDPMVPDITSDSKGYLHTYRTKHPLRLLYVDGQSAAKSQRGTLDVQDLVLLHNNPPAAGLQGVDPSHEPWSPRDAISTGQDDERPHHGPMGEGERAIGLCRLAREEWGGQIDGILRMEGGFEIILCNFEAHLDVVQIAQAKKGGDHGPPGSGGNADAQNYYEAVAARYHGIGGGRVKLDYDNFVTVFDFAEVLYFDETGKPRVDNSSTNAITAIRVAVDDMVARPEVAVTTDWQGVTDMVIARYAKRVEYLASGNITTLSDFQSEVDRALRPFIDYGSDEVSSSTISRCASQFLPSALQPDAAPLSAIGNVTTVLCKTLHAVSAIDTLAHGISTIRALKSWLGWTVWKECRGCSANEICFLPIWPVGSEADFTQPRCTSNVEGEEGGYWRDMERALGYGP